MPVVMPTHGHGQGFADLNFLVPQWPRRGAIARGLAESADFSLAAARRSRSLTVLNFGATYAIDRQLTLGLQVFNLTSKKGNGVSKVCLVLGTRGGQRGMRGRASMTAMCTPWSHEACGCPPGGTSSPL